MSALELLVFAAGVTPVIIATVFGVRYRRDADRRLQLALEEERAETRLRYMGEEEVTERRQSFSAWPWGHR